MPNQKEEKLFETKAKQLLSYLRHEMRYNPLILPRPFFVEFTGSPSAGKTTTIKELDKLLRRQGLRVLCPQEGAEVIRHIERTTPLYNIRTGMYAAEILADLSNGHLYDVVIFDRCIFDAYCWMEYWFEKGKLSIKEKENIQAFFLSKFFTANLDAALILISDPKVAMERELRIALSSKLGETTNPKTVATLVERYTNAFRTLSPQYPQLRLLDTSALDEYTMVSKIANLLLDMLIAKTKNGS